MYCLVIKYDLLNIMKNYSFNDFIWQESFKSVFRM